MELKDCYIGKIVRLDVSYNSLSSAYYIGHIIGLSMDSNKFLMIDVKFADDELRPCNLSELKEID